MPARIVSVLSRRSFPFLLVLGAGLRIGLYLGNRSLWFDEARVALNILHKGLWELPGPLEFGQAAPPGFLLLVKVAQQLFGSSEYALRLVPLLWGLASLVLFFHLAKSRLRPGAAALACLLFAIAEPLVYYSAEAKQYSGDVAVELALWFVASRIDAGSLRLRGAVLLGLAGAAALFFSHTAIFVLGGMGLVLLAAARPRRGLRSLAPVMLIGSLWAAAFAGVYVLSLRRLAADTRLVQYFAERAPGFPPAGVFSACRWVAGRFFEVFRFPGGLGGFGIPALCAVVGVLVLWRRDPREITTWVAPAGLALLAALARIYPFDGRLILFVAPAIFLLVAEGAEELIARARPIGWLRTPAAAALIVLLVFHPAVEASRGIGRPRYFEQLRPVLEHVSLARRPGDVVVLYYNSQFAARYYLETRRLSLADLPVADLLVPAAVEASGDWSAPALLSRPPGFFVGSISRNNPAQYARELDALAGRARVWVVFSHVHASRAAEERRFFLEHLDGMGTKLEAFEQPGASAFLYDLRAR